MHNRSSIQPATDARVVGVNGNIVQIETTGGALVKNEVAFVCVGQERLKAEVLRVYGNEADLQVFEDTDGVSYGDPVERTGAMLSVELGPGLLGQVFDGLQNPLPELAELDGFFLRRGRDIPSLDRERTWEFIPTCGIDEVVTAGFPVGYVEERNIRHKVLVPFALAGPWRVASVRSGTAHIDEPLVHLQNEFGHRTSVSLLQRWPVRVPLPQALLKRGEVERLYPQHPLITTTRLIDTFFPIALGGTACIPGPFGAGKTVLQGLIARYSAVDIVVVVACGERAGEVVETIRDFGHMEDPRTGGKLMDRTIIVCNTSSMPVAAREASIYTGITLGEYYRHMGLNVLLIADSTSRWAQAMRETSGRLEEIPGEEAFPAYLDSSIKAVYERAGVLRTSDQSVGTLTMIGTVSPAGGNFEEPVTQSTLNAVKCFLGLSYDRAYKRFYPAIDPLISWSRYREQLQSYFNREFASNWTETVDAMQHLLEQGDDVRQMMQVTGEEGITLADYATYWKAVCVDLAYLQQDAFDPVDVSVPVERQIECFLLLNRLLHRAYAFADKDQVRDFFTRLSGLLRNLNYAPRDSREFQDHLDQIEKLETAHLADT